VHWYQCIFKQSQLTHIYSSLTFVVGMGFMRGYQFFALTLLLAAPAFAHGGGLDASGCHNDRKRGGYHCHGARQYTASPLKA
jgi:hypothetical protein